MKRFSQQLHKESQSVELQTAERRELRERIVAYMEYHPLPNAHAPAPATPIAETFRVIPFSYIARVGAALATLLLVIVPVLAEQAVPGDKLYAIKVSFNEEVRSTLAMSPHQKIEWETELLNRRIAEARLLASEGRLTEEVEAEVAQAVKTHTENAKRGIEQLRSTDAEEASLEAIELATTLEVQSASLKEKQSDESDEDSLANVITESLIKETRPADTPSFERLLARVEANTTRLYELLETLDLAESSADHQDITRRIEDIERSVEEAITQRDLSDEGARMMLVETLQGTQKLIVFMTEIRNGQKFEVEDFIPVKLTPEEEAAKKTQFEEDIQVQLTEIATLITVSNDPLATEKANAALEHMTELQASLASSTDFMVTSDLYANIISIATDTKTLLTQSTTTNATTTESIATTTDQAESDPVESAETPEETASTTEGE